jgi:hypothetical protein
MFTDGCVKVLQWHADDANGSKMSADIYQSTLILELISVELRLTFHFD